MVAVCFIRGAIYAFDVESQIIDSFSFCYRQESSGINSFSMCPTEPRVSKSIYRG